MLSALRTTSVFLSLFFESLSVSVSVSVSNYAPLCLCIYNNIYVRACGFRRGRGYQIFALPEGVEDWRTLRKISVWQTASALEQEFRERAVHTALSYTVLYCTVLCCTALHFTELDCIVLYCTVLYCTALSYTVMYRTVLYRNVLYFNVLNYIVAL